MRSLSLSCMLACVLFTSTTLAAPPSPETVYSSPAGDHDIACRGQPQMEKLVASAKGSVEGMAATLKSEGCFFVRIQGAPVGEAIDFGCH